MRAAFETRKLRSMGSMCRYEDTVIKANSFNYSQLVTSPLVNMQVPSLDNLKKIMSALETSLKEYKESRQIVYNKLDEIQRRYVKRYNYFRRILYEKCKEMEYVGENTKFELGKSHSIHRQTMVLFEYNCKEVQCALYARYQYNHNYMQRHIKLITETMEKYLEKHRRLTQEDYDKMVREIMRVQEISSTILDENNKLKIKIKDLEFSLKVLNEEKSLILYELVQKKGLVCRLSNYLNSIDHQFSRQAKQFSEPDLVQTIQKGKSITEDMQIYLAKKDIVADDFEEILSKLKRRKSVTNQSSSQQSKSEKVHRPPKSFLASSGHCFVTSKHVSLSRQSKNTTKDFSLSVRRGRYSETIDYLKTALYRERKKRLYYGSLLNRLLYQNEYINSILDQIVESNDEKNANRQNYIGVGGGKSSHTSKVREEEQLKLIGMLKDMKRRLMKVENVNVNCGYADSKLSQEIAALYTL